MEYIFQLGSFPYISLAEILNVLKSEKIPFNIIDLDIIGKELHIEIENIEPSIFMKILGGTRSIYSIGENKLYKQTVSEYKKREFGKPFVDSKSGLLPSKLAKMMINLSFTPSGVKKIYDPFCGSGTIITESLVMGLSGIGSDQDQRTVNGAILNSKWLQKEYEIPANRFEFFVSDVREDNLEKLKTKEIDAIVSEPYMGIAVSRPLKMGANDQVNLNRVEIVLEAALKKASAILDIGKRMVIVIPQYKTVKGIHKLPISEKYKSYSFKKLDLFEGLDIDKNQDLLYFRPKAIVLRELFILEKI